MTALWRSLSDRFDALATRERALVFLAVLVGTALVFDAAVAHPLQQRRERLAQELAGTRQAIRTADTVLAAQSAAADPEAVKRSYRDALRRQLAELDRAMQGLQQGLVPPERMAKLLEEMLERAGGLQVESLKTLPPQRIEPKGSAGGGRAKAVAAPSDRTIYQHTFEISLHGNYFDVHRFLTRLEKLPWQMFWRRLEVSTRQHPRLSVTLTVQTLSLSKAWLVV